MHVLASCLGCGGSNLPLGAELRLWVSGEEGHLALGHLAYRCLEAMGRSISTSVSARPVHTPLGYLIGVGAVLVLGAVGGVGEGLVAALVLTHVWLLPGVGPQMRLQVLQARVGLRAALKLARGGFGQ